MKQTPTQWNIVGKVAIGVLLVTSFMLFLSQTIVDKGIVIGGTIEVAVQPGVRTPQKNVYFVKVHKTGSSTLQNIIYRFAIRNNLKIAIYDKPYGMPFPDIAKPQYLFENIADKSFKPFNIMTEHAIYSNEYPWKYMEKDTVAIVSFREPLSYLHSAFNFFNLAKKFHLQKYKDPVYTFLSKGPENFRNYSTAFHWTKNLQLTSMGYPSKDNITREDVLRFIDNQIEPNIKIILTLERFDEGMVLLKRKLHWTTKDIIYRIVYPTSRKMKKPKRDESTVKQMREIFKNFSYGDHVLYEYLSNKVDQEIASQDESFTEEVLEYHTAKTTVTKFCSSVCANFNRTKMINQPKNTITDTMKNFLSHSIKIAPSTHGFHEGFSWSYRDCALTSFFTFDFQVAIRVDQYPGACHAGKGSPVKTKWSPPGQSGYSNSWCDNKSHTIYSFPWQMILKTFLKKCK